MQSSTAGVVSGPRLCPGGNASDSAFGTQTPLIENLRAEEATKNTFQPHSDPDYVPKAASALLESGWAVLRGILNQNDIDALSQTAHEVAAKILLHDSSRLGNRGPRRYSYGGASKTHHMVHEQAWARLLDNKLLTPVLDFLYGGEYVAVGGGGDFVLGSTDTHQRLHVDLQRPEMYDVAYPPAAIAANFAVSHVSCEDGPMRIVPKTQRLPLASADEASRASGSAHMSSLEREATFETSLGLSRLIICPLEPGDVLLRDMRLWHGGTPNLGNATRLLPSAEFLAPWYADLTQGTDDHFAPRPILPFEHWWQMSARGRKSTQRILSVPKSVDSGIRSSFVLLLPYVAEDRL